MTTNEKGRNPGKDATQKTTDANYRGNSADAQRARLLQALEDGPVSTLDARARLDILMPAARIHELRHRHGKNISMVRVRRPTDAGHEHSVALYVLHAGERDLFDDHITHSH